MQSNNLMVTNHQSTKCNQLLFTTDELDHDLQKQQDPNMKPNMFFQIQNQTSKQYTTYHHRHNRNMKIKLNKRQNQEIQYIQYILNKRQQFKLYMFEHLDLMRFKTQKCRLNTYHIYKNCIYYHSPQDQRRKLGNDYVNKEGDGFNYSASLCQSVKSRQQCKDGDQCKYSNNMMEQLYHPERYKKRFCQYYPDDILKCQHRAYCSFAHSELEIRSELIQYYQMDDDFYIFHYKTQWCPFNYQQHDKSSCVYAHNWQDYRRCPIKYNYSHVNCEEWNNDNFIKVYEEGCSQGQLCPKSHGWKESEFHPNNYKVNQCWLLQNCQQKQICPFYHIEDEKRVISPKVHQGLFKLQPRNRLSHNMRLLTRINQFIISTHPSQQLPIYSPPQTDSNQQITSIQNHAQHQKVFSKLQLKLTNDLQNYQIDQQQCQYKSRSVNFSIDQSQFQGIDILNDDSNPQNQTNVQNLQITSSLLAKESKNN